MPKLTIDQREVEVPPGATVLDAARQLGIDIPTLCFLEGYQASTSCLVCMVKIRNGAGGRLAPSCGTPAADGMVVESETEELFQIRRTALELLLSDHVGDCLAPCHFACPAHMDVPNMLRQISAEDLAAAIVTIKRDIALPAVLGRICPKPCEKGCRRSAADGAVAVCQLKRFAADADLASDEPYLPPYAPPTGIRVAIVGAGPTGLSAAYYLAQKGHACVVFDDQPQPGGRLRHEASEAELPREVLDAEIASLVRVGFEVRCGTRVGSTFPFAQLLKEFDAVLVACGAMVRDQAHGWGLPVGPRGLHVNKETFETGVRGVFAAGNAIRGKALAVRSVADGKEVAAAIDQFLSGQTINGPAKPFSSRIGRVYAEEMPQFLTCSSSLPREEPPSGEQPGYQLPQAIQQADRCLHCDCRALESCKLRRYAALYGADPARYPGQRHPFRQIVARSHVIYEPGKCINCGLCIQIAAAAGEPLGLSFVGRGFDVRVGVPFDRTMDEALSKVAAEVVAACPTAALEVRGKGEVGMRTAE
jgi:NADPH-dependent glutamate synthase beta subunit-like oxidoreductase/ferredoxin